MDQATLRDLAEQWWLDRRPAGMYRSDSSFSEAEWDRAETVNSILESAASDWEQLPAVIAALARSTPNKSDLAYIGTWFLETAYLAIGEAVFDALESADISSEERQFIRSGIQL